MAEVKKVVKVPAKPKSATPPVPPMDETRAKDILKECVAFRRTINTVKTDPDTQGTVGQLELQLDGRFTFLELEAIVWLAKNGKGLR